MQSRGAPASECAQSRLADGNKRLSLAATIAFYGLNGRRLTLSNDKACELVMSVAAGVPDAVDQIAAVLAKATETRS
jgi:death-on-curing protein